MKLVNTNRIRVRAVTPMSVTVCVYLDDPDPNVYGPLES